MSETLFIAGDFSGIQDYVLGVSAAGRGQARRLRARSFFVQVIGEMVVWRLMREFGGKWDDLLIAGGGQFLLPVRKSEHLEDRLAVIREELHDRLYEDLHGELALTLCWGDDVAQLLTQKEAAKRRPWSSVMAPAGAWEPGRMSMAEIGDPCEICQRRRGTREEHRDDETVRLCDRCHEDREIGRRLPGISSVALTSGTAQHRMLGTGVIFDPAPGQVSENVIPRPLRRHVPAEDTLEDIAARSRGDSLLGILKADVDSMGVAVHRIAQRGALGALRDFSAELDHFFATQVQSKLEKDARYASIYTVYSGGDDLLLIGPWDIILDFAGEMHKEFAAGPGQKHSLTLSAGIAMTKSKVPVRHTVERAEDLLSRAKDFPSADRPKNRCAALGEVWLWDRHDPILDQGNKIAKWIGSGVCGRSMVHRLLSIAERRNLAERGRRDYKSVVFWAWEVGRNFPSLRTSTGDRLEMAQWGQETLAAWSGNDESPLQELSASLRYALTATRSMTKEERGNG